MISVICCVSNKQVYQDMLKKSLDLQKADFEFILVDNTERAFSSAASALNYGASLASGDIFVFAHQDIYFTDERFLQKIEQALSSSTVMIGVAGIKDETGVVSNLSQGPNNVDGGDIKIQSPIEVQTLDEVLIALRRDVFVNVKFDDKTCDDWHLYAVDLSLTLKHKGITSLVLPLSLYHKSSGKISFGYIQSLIKVVMKHRKAYQRIYTTCTIVPTSRLRFIQYIVRLYWDHVIVGR